MAFKSKDAEQIIDDYTLVASIEATRNRLRRETEQKQKESEEYAKEHGLEKPEDFREHYRAKFAQIGQEKKTDPNACPECGQRKIESRKYYHKESGEQLTKDEARSLFLALVKDNPGADNPVRTEIKFHCGCGGSS